MADAALEFARRDLFLDGHQPAAAVRDGLLVHLGVEREALCSIHVGIAEDAHPIEFRCAHEVAELLEVRPGFAGETDDKRSPQGDARYGAPNALQQLEEGLAVRAALHPREHAAA